MTGWNLPPGCTNRDIDFATGSLGSCSVCGKDVEIRGDEEEDEELICNNCSTLDDRYEAYREQRDEDRKERQAEARAEWINSRHPETD